MDQPSQPSSSSPTVRLGGRAIDRHNPIIRDGRRFTPPPSPNHNSSSAPPSSSSTYHTPLKTRLGLESSEATRVSKRKSKKSQFDAGKSPISCFTSDTPQGSSRYLLSNPVFFDGFVDSDPIPLPIEPEITMDDDLDKNHEDTLVINASKHLSSSQSFLEKKQPDFFDGFLDYDPVMSPDNPFSEPTKDASSPDNPLSEPTKASPTASQSSLEDKDSSSPDFKFSPPQPPPPPPPPSPPPMENNSSSDQVNHRTKYYFKFCKYEVMFETKPNSVCFKGGSLESVTSLQRLCRKSQETSFKTERLCRKEGYRDGRRNAVNCASEYFQS
ncbi:hypothetical protein YC2023_121022 [Brassica napus]